MFKIRMQIVVSGPGNQDEVEKLFLLPFVPFEGLSLHFPFVGENHPNFDRSETILKKYPALFPGIFRLSEITYRTASEEFRVRTYLGFIPPELFEQTLELLDVCLDYGEEWSGLTVRRANGKLNVERT